MQVDSFNVFLVWECLIFLFNRDFKKTTVWTLSPIWNAHLVSSGWLATSKYSIRGVARFPLGPLLELGTSWNTSWSGGSWNWRCYRCLRCCFFLFKFVWSICLKGNQDHKNQIMGWCFFFLCFPALWWIIGHLEAEFHQIQKQQEAEQNIVSLPYLMLNSWSLHVIIVLIFQDFTRQCVFTRIWRLRHPNHAPVVEMITVYHGPKLIHPHCDWG